MNWGTGDCWARICIWISRDFIIITTIFSVKMPGWPKVAVVGGSLDIGKSNCLQLISAHVRGLPFVVIAPAAVADHAPGCACCLPRPPVAAALGGLFLARARGEVPFFRRVVVVVADDVQIRTEIAGDPLVSGRFRLG